MRPKSIVAFERLYILAIVIGLVAAFLTSGGEDYALAAGMIGAGGVILITVISVVITLLLVLLTSRKASNIAKWILIAFYVLGLAFTLPGLALLLGLGVIGILALLQLLLQGIAIALLFTETSRAWFARRHGDPDPEVFR